MQMFAIMRRRTSPIRLGVLACLIFVCATAEAGPVGIGWTPFGAATTAGYIAPNGKLILFDGGVGGWTIRPIPFPHVLVPGGPIVLLPQGPGETWPTVITVSPANKLLRIVDGGLPQVLLPAETFPVGAHLELVQNGSQQLVMGVTGTGDLWSVDPVTNIGHRINSPLESFPFGTSISAVAAGDQYHAFAVDQFGTLQYYFGGGGVWSSVAIAGSLIPGSPVAADIFPIGLPPSPAL